MHPLVDADPGALQIVIPPGPVLALPETEPFDRHLYSLVHRGADLRQGIQG